MAAAYVHNGGRFYFVAAIKNKQTSLYLTNKEIEEQRFVGNISPTILEFTLSLKVFFSTIMAYLHLTCSLYYHTML